MEKKKSYQELLKEYTMTQMQKETSEMEALTEVFLNGLLKKRLVEQLRAQIDDALDRGNKADFLKLSKDLARLTRE